MMLWSCAHGQLRSERGVLSLDSANPRTKERYGLWMSSLCRRTATMCPSGALDESTPQVAILMAEISNGVHQRLLY
jgi:hypothetical protein